MIDCTRDKVFDCDYPLLVCHERKAVILMVGRDGGMSIHTIRYYRATNYARILYASAHTRHLNVYT